MLDGHIKLFIFILTNKYDMYIYIYIVYVTKFTFCQEKNVSADHYVSTQTTLSFI